MRPEPKTLPLALSLAVLAALPLLSGCVGEGELEPIGELLEVGPELPEGVSAGPDGSIAIGRGLAIPEGFALGEEDWKALAFMDGFDCTSIWACYVKCPWGSVCVCEWDGQRWQCVVVPSEDFCKWFKHGCGGVVGGGDWKDKVSLHCPASVWRGGTANCEIRTGNVNLNLLRVDYWWSDLGGDQYGGMTWEGVATKTAMIKVALSMEMMRESFILEQTVNVRPRTVGRLGVWNFERMTHVGYTYGLPPGTKYKAWGAYRAESQHGGGAGVAREGTGPWAGQYYTYLPHRLGGRMFLHRDFHTTGIPHHSAHNTCDGVPSSANVLTVNTMCGYWNIGHEQQHENGANKCLTEGNDARNALGHMEALTGTSQWKVQLDFTAAFEHFTRDDGPFKQAMETRTSTPLSPVIWEWRDEGAWTL